MCIQYKSIIHCEVICIQNCNKLFVKSLLILWQLIKVCCSSKPVNLITNSVTNTVIYQSRSELVNFSIRVLISRFVQNYQKKKNDSSNIFSFACIQGIPKLDIKTNKGGSVDYNYYEK